MITVSEMQNITTDGNVTELQGVVTYDITELRMDPNYIRSLSKWKSDTGNLAFTFILEHYLNDEAFG